MKNGTVKARVNLLEADYQEMKNQFSYIKGEFKALKWIASGLYVPGIVWMIAQAVKFFGGW